MIYLLEVIVFTGLMQLIYIVFLRNKTHHGLSRLYLLLAAILPPLLPFVHLPDSWGERITTLGAVGILPDITIGTTRQSAMAASGAGINYWVVAYLMIALAFLSLRVGGFFRFWLTARKGIATTNNGITIIANSSAGPCSFGNRIFLPSSDIDPMVLQHEMAHIGMRHSLDLAALELLQAAFWPNVFLFLIARELKVVHEFQADSVAATDTGSYAQLILASTFQVQELSLIHSFINHPIKRRIMMLNKKKNGSVFSYAGKTAITLALLCSFAALAQTKKQPKDDKGNPPTVVTEQNNGSSAQHIKPQATTVKPNKEDRPDIMPTYKGNISEYLSKSLVYPKYAKEHKIEGRVIVKFIVSKEGKVTKPEIVRSPTLPAPDTSLANAAISVISKMPAAWTPATKKGKNVDCEFYQPITFKL